MEYPDPDEEFELMHADELELMNEMESEDFSFPSNRIITSKPKPKRQLDFAEGSSCTTSTSTSDLSTDPAKKPTIAKSILSDYPSDDDLLVLRDVSDPPSSAEPQLSTSFIQGSNFLNNTENIPLGNNKRTASSLFGDISDIELELSSQTKRQRLEDENSVKEARQKLLIETIVEQRKKINEEKTSFRLGAAQKVKKLEDCICYGSVPKWRFMPACVKGERVYIRLHTEEKVSEDMKNIHCKTKATGFLGVSYKELYTLAMSDVSKKINKLEATKKKSDDVIAYENKDLWVEKYKPKVYLQLLSDEATNRSLLYWLKLWDKIVFNKEPKVLKHGFQGQEKRDILDEHHRPVQKVALLCGPPGLGKTTLAHMIAKQAGYCPVEVNASDDRTAQSFRTALDAATQMKSVMGTNPHPNCLILDEIDGAPQPAIDVLIKYVTEKGDAKTKKKKGLGILKRPIICICNDIYVPALRSLRQIAYTIVFPPTSSTRLGERLVEISKMESIITDLGTMMVLSEKSNNDIRSCLSVLQYLKAKSPRVTLSQIQSSSVGTKDMQQGLFSVWETVFQIKLHKKGQGAAAATKSSDSTGGNRFQLGSSSNEVFRTVQSYGDYDRLTVGAFENYAKLRPAESSLTPVVKAMGWFVFQDLVSSYIHESQNYSLYPYLPWAFVQWHSLFASIQRPKLAYPSTFYESTARLQRNRQVLDFLFAGIAPKLQSYQQRCNLLLDVAPLLVELITPNVRPVSSQLYSRKEKNELCRVVGVMADYNVNYSQIRSPDGHYNFQLDPNIEDLVCFGERPRENVTTYTVRQMLSKEVECEKIRRAAAKSVEFLNGGIPPADVDQPVPIPDMNATPQTKERPQLPNHLQKLTPKALKKKVADIQAKDFFGRVVEQSLSKLKNKAKTDEIVKSDIWYHFKEGYNNAVRKNVYISDLL